MKLSGQVALITGAASGIGREIALTFARHGCRIGVNDIDADGAQALVRDIEAAGGEGVALRADVSDSIEVGAMFEQLRDRWSELDILVNNAGIAVLSDSVRENMTLAAMELAQSGTSQRVIGATDNMTDSHWRRTLSVHLDGTFYCTREALKMMVPRGRGRIINMASVAGLTGLLGSPDYSAAKAGIIGLTKAVAREVVRHGICVNAIAPGFVDTALLNVLDDPMKQMIALQTPQGRLGTVAEVAAVAVYLASEESSFMVGQVLSPNGGYYM
jgi:3-oxoacyl-[acyl-carrier protein] reductase